MRTYVYLRRVKPLYTYCRLKLATWSYNHS